MVYKQKKSKYWWYKFMWNGEQVRESTKQTNKRTAEQMEAAHRTSLAKGEVGIREKKSVPTLKEFADADFLPFVRATFSAKPKTRSFYENGVKNLLAFSGLAKESLNEITSEHVGAYAATRREARGKRGLKMQIASVNRELQVLRRMFTLAEEWRRVERALPKVKMLPGEKHRERVLTEAEEKLYLRGTTSDAMEQFADHALLQDVALILIDCGLRPEECFRLRRRENIVGNNIEVHYGKTANARRRIPMTLRVSAVLDMRLQRANSEWVFPAPTKSGHIEPSSLKKQHRRAVAEATRILREETGDQLTTLEPFELYTFRHTCITRWAETMDPWTLAYYAGHSHMNTTKRYVHPQERTLEKGMKKAREAQSGHTSGHTEENTDLLEGVATSVTV